MRLVLLLSTLVLPLAPGAAAEPCRLCADDGRAREERAPAPVRVEVETSLDFDRVLLAGRGNGIARIAADGSWTSTGAITALSGRAMVGTVVIQGEPNRLIRVELPKRIELRALNGRRLTLDNVTTDLLSAPRLDGSGRLVFHFGGEITVEDDAEGDYRGDVPITVDYF